MNARKQSAVLNDQYSSWASVKVGVPKFLVLFFLTFINDLFDNLFSIAKLFADGTSLFSVVQEITLSAKNLYDDLKKKNKWTF